ncbi:hypothetical protein BH23DEI1_BH23DEI1_23170 [soil metagenome]
MLDGVRGVAAAAGLAWVLLSGSALAVGDLAGIVRAVAALLLVVLAVAAARSDAVRRAGAPLLAIYSAGLTATTLLVGFGVFGDATLEGRVRLFLDDLNVLGAALVTAFVGFVALAPRRRSMWWRWVWWSWPLVALAVVLTGSRTSTGALLAAGTLWLTLQLARGRPRLLVAPVVALAVLAAAAFAWQRGVVEMTPNLLAAANDLGDVAWRHDLAERVEVVDDAAPGPFAGTRAQRMSARALDGRRHLVHQSIGRSETDVPYVASIYLRAGEPLQLLLTSHLARVTCEVDVVWRRCVTPVGFGDDHAQRQLHLQAVERGGHVEVEVYGAQYERGLEATPFLARPAWVPQAMVNRLDLRRLSLLPTYRVVPVMAGLDIAREHPLFGVGLEASREAFAARTGEHLSRPVTYAHNLVVQILAVHGALGLVAMLVVLVSLLAAAGREGVVRLAPLLVALALLNTYDVTLFHATVFPAALLAVAHQTGAHRPRHERRATG